MNARRRQYFSFARLCFALAVLVSSGRAFAADAVCTLDRATGTTIEAAPFMPHAYGARWNLAANRIALMEPGSDGYYTVFTVKPDGSDRRYLPQVSGKHEGAPYWHPSGRYLLFIAEKKDHKDRDMFSNRDYGALPGFGMHDDLWLATPDGKHVWQLTDAPEGKHQGELLPVFAPDGKHIAWSSRQPDGHYALQVADFVETPQPHLANIRSYQPGGKVYYETGSFTSDSASLVYTSDQDTHSFWNGQIYRLDLATGKSTRLTEGKDYNEHPVVVKTPTGDWVVYMSTQGIRRSFGHFFLGTDWHAMKLDGSGAKRLTMMNTKAKDNPEYAGQLQVGCTVAISPRGDYFLGDVQDNLIKQTGMVRTVRLTCN